MYQHKSSFLNVRPNFPMGAEFHKTSMEDGGSRNNFIGSRRDDIHIPFYNENSQQFRPMGQGYSTQGNSMPLYLANKAEPLPGYNTPRFGFNKDRLIQGFPQPGGENVTKYSQDNMAVRESEGFWDRRNEGQDNMPGRGNFNAGRINNSAGDMDNNPSRMEYKATRNIAGYTTYTVNRDGESTKVIPPIKEQHAFSASNKRSSNPWTDFFDNPVQEEYGGRNSNKNPPNFNRNEVAGSFANKDFSFENVTDRENGFKRQHHEEHEEMMFEEKLTQKEQKRRNEILIEKRRRQRLMEEETRRKEAMLEEKRKKLELEEMRLEERIRQQRKLESEHGERFYREPGHRGRGRHRSRSHDRESRSFRKYDNDYDRRYKSKERFYEDERRGREFSRKRKFEPYPSRGSRRSFEDEAKEQEIVHQAIVLKKNLQKIQKTIEATDVSWRPVKPAAKYKYVKPGYERKSQSLVKRSPPKLFYCSFCEEDTKNEEEHTAHINKVEHSVAVEKKEKLYEDTVLEIQKAAQEKYLDVFVKQYCVRCFLPYTGNLESHRETHKHKVMVKYLSCFCTYCDVTLPTRFEYEKHQLLIQHIRNCQYSVASGKVDGECPEEYNGESIGENLLKSTRGRYCKPCGTFGTGSQHKITHHCASKKHIQNYNKLVQGEKGASTEEKPETKLPKEDAQNVPQKLEENEEKESKQKENEEK